MLIQRLTIREDFCKGCGLCMEYCLSKALFTQTDKTNARGYHPIGWKGTCKFCGLCYHSCPHGAIEVEYYEESALERESGSR